MLDWFNLLKSPVFRRFWVALLGNHLAGWSVIAALPILVADRYGVGMELVASLGLRVIPKVLLAPLASGMLRRFGPGRVAGCAMAGEAVLSALLPWADSLVMLETLIATIGTLDLFIMPGLFLLRQPITPPGQEMAANTLFSVAERLGRIMGPVLGGLLIAAHPSAAFLAFGALLAAAAVPVGRMARAPTPANSAGGSIAAFLHILRTDSQVVGLLICALTYMVLLGGLRPFLFWANRDWFTSVDAAWTGLLAAQGAGALVGAFVFAAFARRMMRHASAYTLTVAIGFVECAILWLLLLTGTPLQAMLVLAASGMPEVISAAAWFTAVQRRLSSERQAILYTFSASLWDLAYAIGVASAALHAEGWLTLSAYWACLCFVATAPLPPLFFFRHAAIA